MFQFDSMSVQLLPGDEELEYQSLASKTQDLSEHDTVYFSDSDHSQQLPLKEKINKIANPSVKILINNYQSINNKSLSNQKPTTKIQTQKFTPLKECGFKVVPNNNKSIKSKTQIITEFSSYVYNESEIKQDFCIQYFQARKKKKIIKDFDSSPLENMEDEEFGEDNNQQHNFDNKHIYKHRKNLFPYFSNHFRQSLKFDKDFQKELALKATVSNPVHYILRFINQFKVSNKSGIMHLIKQNDYNVNQALYLWFSKYLNIMLSKTKNSKNKKINETHKLRQKAFLQSAGSIIEYLNQFM